MAAILKVPKDELVEDTRPFSDLDVDSLALSEIAALFDVVYGAVDVLDRSDAELRELTAVELHRLCVSPVTA
ncbi:hypothetical protein DSM104299_05278 [Baekduia alba]|nr:hypothetical protein DSM104299_05278 [Baekduia alba]